MQLRNYFSSTVGTGVMATANGSGEVDTALYASPHFISDDTIAFIMRDKLTRANLQTNPGAKYMFIEHSHGFKGMRLFLQMIGESTDQEAIETMSRRNISIEQNEALCPRFLVTFKVIKALQLVGGKEISIGQSPSNEKYSSSCLLHVQRTAHTFSHQIGSAHYKTQ